MANKGLKEDYRFSYKEEITEQANFHYPSLYQLIKIILKHKERHALDLKVTTSKT
ncbi:hypothetical protein N8385_07195 [Cyclobacteriaceae bacterium]|jgi:primosomal protein N' (replication factor Y)|nr:hypothetical protein [Cyclobacteriaceae bacterium]|tara:strand:+ start:1526 stop:1690 length:165 start_codon:yes stop_codon:yes gene_type:complete